MSTTIAFASLPGAREILREFDTASSRPLVHLVRGRCGTGKSTLLAAIRDRLHARGIVSRADVPMDDGPDIGPDAAPAALIVDDAHTLEPAALERLRAVVESGNRTVVIATRPRPHDPALRALAEAVSRRGRMLELRALGASDIAPFARELGMTVPRSVTQHIHRQTGGIHGGVVTALTAACAARLDAGIAAVDVAVTNWARALLDRTEPDLLEVLVVAATGAGLDPGELTEVLGLEHSTAWDLIDRARAGALVTDADLLPAPAVAPLRTLVGDRRFLTVQRRLLEARLDAGLLRDNTALVLAESGVRDPRLAEFLCAAAEKTDDAVRFYQGAVAAGADPQVVAVRWAEAAARAGDGDTALRLAEPVLARPGVSDVDLAAAVRICAGVWIRRGLVQRAAQLYAWLGAHRVGADWAVGATVQYLAGEVEAAAALSATADRWPPTAATARAASIVTALSRSVGAAAPVVAAVPEAGAGRSATADSRPDAAAAIPLVAAAGPPSLAAA
ncbi:LuxR family transcriptional regulator, partial [Nocardia sp. alder85J]|nr:LuxR family transcriptional regulator [Nocardia sp. alder85J]